MKTQQRCFSPSSSPKTAPGFGTFADVVMTDVRDATKRDERGSGRGVSFWDGSSRNDSHDAAAALPKGQLVKANPPQPELITVKFSSWSELTMLNYTLMLHIHLPLTCNKNAKRYGFF